MKNGLKEKIIISGDLKDNTNIARFYHSFNPLECLLQQIIGSVKQLQADNPEVVEKNVSEILKAVFEMEIHFKKVTKESFAEHETYKQAS